MSTPEVSVVIPTIEEESVFKVIDEIRERLGKDVEIIIVDKSSDAYQARLKKTGATVITQTDKGVENALMTGLRSANGRILASVDADATHGLEGFVSGIKLVESGEADLVLGNRLAGLQEGSMLPYLKFGNASLSKIFSLLYGHKVSDVLTGLFVMKRSTFNDIKDVKPYRAGIAFFAIELAKRGYVVKEVDIKYYVRSKGESKLAKSKFGYGLNVGLEMVKRRF